MKALRADLQRQLRWLDDLRDQLHTTIIQVGKEAIRTRPVTPTDADPPVPTEVPAVDASPLAFPRLRGPEPFGIVLHWEENTLLKP